MTRLPLLVAALAALASVSLPCASPALIVPGLSKLPKLSPKLDNLVALWKGGKTAQAEAAAAAFAKNADSMPPGSRGYLFDRPLAVHRLVERVNMLSRDLAKEIRQLAARARLSAGVSPAKAVLQAAREGRALPAEQFEELMRRLMSISAETSIARAVNHGQLPAGLAKGLPRDTVDLFKAMTARIKEQRLLGGGGGPYARADGMLQSLEEAAATGKLLRAVEGGQARKLAAAQLDEVLAAMRKPAASRSTLEKRLAEAYARGRGGAPAAGKPTKAAPLAPAKGEAAAAVTKAARRMSPERFDWEKAVATRLLAGDGYRGRADGLVAAATARVQDAAATGRSLPAAERARALLAGKADSLTPDESRLLAALEAYGQKVPSARASPGFGALRSPRAEGELRELLGLLRDGSADDVASFFLNGPNGRGADFVAALGENTQLGRQLREAAEAHRMKLPRADVAAPMTESYTTRTASGLDVTFNGGKPQRMFGEELEVPYYQLQYRAEDVEKALRRAAPEEAAWTVARDSAQGRLVERTHELIVKGERLPPANSRALYRALMSEQPQPQDLYLIRAARKNEDSVRQALDTSVSGSDMGWPRSVPAQ